MYMCRSFVELRKTSVVWNYKYADVEFGRLQARDLLQHLWTGPISNAPVDIVQVCSSGWVDCWVHLLILRHAPVWEAQGWRRRTFAASCLQEDLHCDLVVPSWA